MTTTIKTRPRPGAMNPTTTKDVEQHSALTSVLLHLVPGLLSLGALFALSQPFLYRSLGIAPELGPLFGYTAANLLVLVPPGSMSSLPWPCGGNYV